MSTPATDKSLLHVAFPSNATTQQPPLSGATTSATATQHPTGKPASLLDVARNKLCNSHATGSRNGMQQAPENDEGAPSLLRVAVASNLPMQQAKRGTSWGWRLTLPSGDVVEVFSVPEMTHAEALAFDREATHAEPIKGAAVRPSASRMTTAEENAIRQWLAAIGENDSTTVEEVVADCRVNVGARAYFLKRASEAHQ